MTRLLLCLLLLSGCTEAWAISECGHACINTGSKMASYSAAAGCVCESARDGGR
jgi:hypothetical protein